MRLLFIGDIVGKPGRKVVSSILPDLKKSMKIDLVIANAENLAGGKGITPKTIHEMRGVGVNFFTGGNHIFSHPEGLEYVSHESCPLVVPLNFPPEAPGKRFHILTSLSGKRVLIVSLLGQTFMPQQVDCPFRSVETLLDSLSPDSFDVSIIDFHAEATSEKYAMKAFLEGRVTALFGTHTHVPTADADISPLGTAYITDVGMNGSLDSCIGVRSSLILKKLITQLPVSHVLENKGRMQFNAIFLDVTNSGMLRRIQHIRRII